MNTFVAGWMAGLVFHLLCAIFIVMPLAEDKGKIEVQDQAVEKGYGEYVIEDKQIVFKWIDKSDFTQ